MSAANKQVRRICRALGLALLLFVGTSCAVTVRGKTEMLFFDSHPRGAVVSLPNFLSCVTPCVLDVQRENLKITFSKEGCEDQTAVVSRVLSVGGVLLTTVSAMPIVLQASAFPMPLTRAFGPVVEDIKHGGPFTFDSNLVEVALKCG